MSTQIITKDMMNDAKQITSIEIANLVGKPHNDVLKAIRKMEPAWELEHQGKFSQMQIRESLPNGGYRFRPCFMLSKTESLFIATKFNDVARARLVLRWAELESEKRKGGSEKSASAQILLETEAKLMKRSDEIRRFYIFNTNQNAMGCFTMSQVARKLRMRYHELCMLLEENNIIKNVKGAYELLPPYTLLGYEAYRHHESYKLDGCLRQSNYMVWTAEGLEFIRNKVKQIRKSR